MQQGDCSKSARKGDAGKTGEIGRPLDAENSALRRSGRLLAVADLLWIPQAGLIAVALGTLLAAIYAPQDDATPTSLFFGPVALAVLGIALLAALRVGLQFRAANLARRTASAIQVRARTELLSAATSRSPAASFPSSGAFAAHVTEQIDLLGPYFRNFVPQMMRLKLVPIGIVLATLWFSWLAALILLICGPVIPLFMALIGMRAKSASARQQEELTRLSGILMDRIKGLETLTLFGALNRSKDDIERAGETFRIGTMRVLKIAFLSSTVLELFSALGVAFCAVFVGFSLLGEINTGTWGPPLGYSTGLFILLLAPEFFAPLRAYAAAYHDRAAGLAAQEKLGVLFEEIRIDRTDAPAGTQAEAPLASPPAIRFDTVSLSLGGHEVLKDFDLSIEAGETILLEGPSGSGKTTILDCLFGYHGPDGGTIRIGGADPVSVSERLRGHAIWLGQAPRLFHGSLKANLLKGAQEPGRVTDEDIWTALRLAGADELVRRLPNGLATLLGEEGFGLSVGEIRRVALARAALRQDAVLFLADEPTAGLDDETARDVIEGLKTLAAGRTAVIATHDPEVLAMPGRRVDLNARASELPLEAAI
ncbi:thiol reductant ABC exporter subunit CydD [Roseibium aggregatum]|uniref:Thiol reductant ABC exporter subunit CydD n=1 Tax=Roseibium aggregatum TaxID=187304 RepID=A0A939ECP7_9HYPH|nr:thiol reductant ABC exporter subunit CydD [Roseibium aggregatum]MBN9670147.1 thiol reductant ABC exporter subunit CydD [Roseibium aggregatum]